MGFSLTLHYLRTDKDYSNNLQNYLGRKVSRKVSGIILAGGKGTRMQNANKGLQVFEGRMLIESVISRLSPQVDEIIISANQDIVAYEKLGHQVVTDSGNSLGPLSGIQSAAQRTIHDNIFITACDMPYLPETIVAELLKENAPVTVAESNDGIEPLASLVNQTAIKLIDECLLEQRYSVVHWLTKCGAVTVPMQHLGKTAFFNINTLEELT